MTTIPTTIQERVVLPGAGGGNTDSSNAIALGDIIAMLKQRMITIIILSILFSGMAVGAFFLLYFQFPGYFAEAFVECISDAPETPMQLEQKTLEDDPYLRFVNSQAQLIVSRSNLATVLQDEEVRATQWFQNLEPDKRLLELEDSLRCAPIRDTNYIRVALTTRHPGDPHKIVNRVVETYLNEVKDKAKVRYRNELATYKRELADVRNKIQLKKEQIREFQTTLPAGEVGADLQNAGGGVVLEQLKLDLQTVAELEQQTAELESLMRIYSDPEGPAINPEDRLQVEQDMRVMQLDSQVFSIEQELRVLLSQFGANHREYKEMQRRLEEAESQLAIARANRLREVVDFKKQQIETAFYNSQNALLLARERLAETQAQQADLDRKLSEYRMLLDDQELLRETEKRLMEYIEEIERIVSKSSAIRVERAISAQEPLKRSFPSLFMLPAFVVLAIVGAIGIGLGLELIDNSVKTSQDIVRHVGLAMLGSIPDVDDEEVEIERVEAAVLEAPQSMVTEAFRTVRSNLQFSAPAERLKSILITSPKPEDGRTTVACNLAASLATSGKRVLLVDGNFRRPAIRRFFSKVGQKGYTNILIGDAAIDDCIHNTGLANLDVIGSGPIPPNPAELLGNELSSKFISAVTTKYDHVVFDSPPVLLASDATVLATLVDGVILVCRAKDNTRGVVQRTRTLLTTVGAHIFGAVLNVAQARRGGYFREQLRTFYEYQHEEDDQSSAGTRALPDKDETNNE